MTLNPSNSNNLEHLALEGFIYCSNVMSYSFDHTMTSPLKSNVTFEFSAAIFLYRRGSFRRTTPF